jgi:DNA-binding NtrC family response regulator
LEIKEVNRLRRDAKEVFSKEKVVPIAPLSSSTFVEVGEVTRDEGIFICASDPMHRIKEIIDQIANTDVTVLIQGESGVGKEVVARSIHLNSFRKETLVKVNQLLFHKRAGKRTFGYENSATGPTNRNKEI